ncbi:hypothetical protein CKO45_10545 [Paracraurococcus ruber]|uniref:Lipoprotein n=2 Tax=Paracraurococcus ruber TaxID=77675 RepID=A0ABS1CWG8_9PROT|nr:hypothetical protein [Paracraurococcus ruber]
MTWGRGLAIAALAALSACAEGGAGTGAPAPTAAPAAPVAAGPAGTRLDGRYAGRGDLTASRSSVCGPQQINRSLVVANGEGRLVIDQARNDIAVGPVSADGIVTLHSPTGRGTTVAGRIENGVFTGEQRGTQCTRSLSLRKQS